MIGKFRLPFLVGFCQLLCDCVESSTEALSEFLDDVSHVFHLNVDLRGEPALNRDQTGGQAIDLCVEIAESRFEVVHACFETIEPRFEVIEPHFEVVEPCFKAIEPNFETAHFGVDPVDLRFNSFQAFLHSPSLVRGIVASSSGG